MSGEIAVKLKISGIVQGVFFRTSTRNHASMLGLSGWVRNNPDGSVEVWAQGDREGLMELISWCRHGPPGASVEEVTVDWVTPGNMRGFSIQR